MYVGLIIIALLGFVFSMGLKEMERFVIPWKAER
jgi:NitT/TauT family transport system permease protein